MKLSLIILNYKKSSLTIACVKSLYQHYAQEFETSQIELIIVDNASPDDSVTAINKIIKEKKYKNAHLIANPTNDGFGAGCNVGANKATGDLILFLNNDTLVQDKSILTMADYLNIHLEIAILGGQLYNEDGSKQPSTGKFYTPWYAFLLLFGGQKLGILDKSPSIIQPVDWVKGALLMIRKDDFDQLKGFDEKMFMYMEDMEFCYRAHLAGKSTYFYPEVHIIHKEHGSANKTFAIVNIYTNLLYFYKKHRSPLEYQTIKILSQMKARMLICIGKVTHTPYLTETYTRALDAIG